MKRISRNGIYFWHFNNLAQETAIDHFVSDRQSGEKELTLSFGSSPDKEEIKHNRKLVAEAMGITPDKLVLPSQVHLTRIVHVTHDTSKESLLDTDALISNEKGICIAVMSADCVPILLYDKCNHAVGAVHSGWRGTVAGILAKTLAKMNETFGTRGEDIVAGIGPSVSQESYEVGGEVIAEVERAFGNDSGLMIKKPNDKAQLDLWQANKIQLRDFGVPDDQIEISDLCTVKNNQHFFSARKGDAGRFAAGIMLR
ncbi:peptidoglycan editing factor PgeF [Pseudochryseolinea flava]|uniref:Purine nucleoside phosphorylase n=1 Tax=Pseudochryseolinea flava TaxID=2059302 RepID=A0A364Y4A5_9BACT|nr:peptidoglycan editing factor PgeF [Pseudochryseolinea flava]RAW00871.1 peptidoglycan editing factor PgeF [Pseudochryseolinea flava]